jgi:hypothetical protein
MTGGAAVRTMDELIRAYTDETHRRIHCDGGFPVQVVRGR